MGQETTARKSDSLIITYLELRKAIGLLGLALPVLLVVGKYLFEGPGIQTSISAYYHSVMRDVLVGCLWAIAIFLLSYRGYGRRDDLAGDLACLFAICVALFPTVPLGEVTAVERILGGVHYGFAAALFLILAYFCLVLFRKGVPEPTPQKIQRNRLYAISGYVILACIAAIGVVSILPEDSWVNRLDPVFWLEAIAIWAFGWSWFVKGEGILKDR